MENLNFPPLLAAMPGTILHIASANEVLTGLTLLVGLAYQGYKFVKEVRKDRKK